MGSIPFTGIKIFLLKLYLNPNYVVNLQQKSKINNQFKSNMYFLQLISLFFLQKPVKESYNNQQKSKLYFNILLTNYHRSGINIFELNYLYLLYHQQYFRQILKTPIILKTVNVKQLIPGRILKYMTTIGKNIYWKKYKIIHYNEITEILFICIWIKNLNLFMQWVKNLFEKARLREHRRLFGLLKLLLESVVWEYNVFFNLKGLRLMMAGKIGKAGSVRKSKMYLKKGKYTYTTKSIALVSQTKTIRTFTGSLCFKFELFF